VTWEPRSVLPAAVRRRDAACTERASGERRTPERSGAAELEGDGGGLQRHREPRAAVPSARAEKVLLSTGHSCSSEALRAAHEHNTNHASKMRLIFNYQFSSSQIPKRFAKGPGKAVSGGKVEGRFFSRSWPLPRVGCELLRAEPLCFHGTWPSTALLTVGCGRCSNRCL